MAREHHDCTKRSQESALRTFWAQARRRVQRSRPENREGKRAGDRLPEQRGGSRDPQSFQQSSAHSGGATEPPGRVHGQKSRQIGAVAGLLFFLAGCAAHREQPPVMPAPPPSAPAPASTPLPHRIPTPTPTPAPTPSPQSSRVDSEIHVPKNAKVLYTELGFASWYGPGFQKRNAANGQPYDMNAMTAAHRTLPLNTIVRVTDLKTGESVLLRVTDRGPFVNDRIIDLSRAAARRLSVYQHGTALVRIEVLETPAPIKEGGRWCVQIGAFQDSDDARKLKEKLARRYRTAKVLQFSSPVGGDWIRVRVADDDKKRAQEVMRETHTEVAMFLVRLD